MSAADGWALPAGMVWCPDCDGQGSVSVMDGGPNLDEREVPCKPCAGEGIVPELRALLVSWPAQPVESILQPLDGTTTPEAAWATAERLAEAMAPDRLAGAVWRTVPWQPYRPPTPKVTP